MSYWISIFGGLLIMMGQHDRSEALFYYFRLEDQVPENHLLRLIEKHIGFELRSTSVFFVRERLQGRASLGMDGSESRPVPTQASAHKLLLQRHQFLH
jgi:hypothetical protein